MPFEEIERIGEYPFTWDWLERMNQVEQLFKNMEVNMRYKLIESLKKLGYLPSPLKNADDLKDNDLIMCSISYILDKVYAAEATAQCGEIQPTEEKQVCCVGMHSIKELIQGKNVVTEKVLLMPADDLMND